MMSSYRNDDSDSESLASSPISSSHFDNRGTEAKKNDVGEGKTNLVIKFCSDKEDLSNLDAGKSVGFIIGLSLQSTFVALREAIDKNKLESLPPGNWKFYIPNLGAMSSGQEAIFTVGEVSRTSNRTA
jgi:hypothetical protein